MASIKFNLKVYSVIVSSIFVMVSKYPGIAQGTLPSFGFTVHTGDTYITDFLISKSGNFHILGSLGGDTLFLNGQKIGHLKGPKGNSLTQSEGYLVMTDRMGKTIKLTQFWGSHGSIPSKPGSGEDAINLNIGAIDHAGNILVSGTFACDTLFFGNEMLPRIGLENIFLLKMDSTGKTLWTKILPHGPALGVITTICFDENNNILVGGEYMENMSIDGDSLKCVSCAVEDRDVFMARFSPEGALKWAKRIGGDRADYITNIAYGGQGIYNLAGDFASTSIFFGNDTLHDSLGAGNDANMYLAQMDSNGNFLWARQTKSIGVEEVSDMQVSQAGEIYILGQYYGNVMTFDNDSTIGGGQNRNSKVFLAKYNRNGTLQWAKSSNGKNEFGARIYIDPDDTVYISGGYCGEVFNLGNMTVQQSDSSNFPKIFIGKLISSGSFLDAKSYGSDGSNQGILRPYPPTGMLYLGGYFNGTSLQVDGVTFSQHKTGQNSECGFIAPLDGKKNSNVKNTVNPALNSFNVFPNPFNSSFFINYTLENQEDVTMVLCDMAGHQISSLVNKNEVPGMHVLEINSIDYHLSKGVYLLKFMSPEGVLTREIINL